MNYAHLCYETDERITTITINRPEALNALTTQTLAELKSAFMEAKQSSETKVVLITGMGDKAFVAGADLNEFGSFGPVEGRQVSKNGQEIMTILENTNKPSIAVINGLALGGGMELALACTFRVCSPNALFGFPEVSLGFIPGYGATQRLPKLVNEARAMEMILVGEPVDAEEAYRIGLVNRIFPSESLMGEARRFAQKLVKKGAFAIEFAMKAVRYRSGLFMQQGLEMESLLAGLTMATEDAKEGISAFLQKRRPVFNDR